MVEEERIKTSIWIKKELWKKFNIFCIEKEISMSEKLEEIINKEIKK
jgi:hypothetical protein